MFRFGQIRRAFQTVELGEGWGRAWDTFGGPKTQEALCVDPGSPLRAVQMLMQPPGQGPSDA